MTDDLLGQLLLRATSPLLEAPSKLGQRAEDTLSQPQLEQSPNMARLKGFVGGGLKGAGNLVSDLSSPASLAGMLIGGPASRLVGLTSSIGQSIYNRL